MPNGQKVVGEWGETQAILMFDLIKTRRCDVPDLVSQDGSFYVEVKASCYGNGGVINRGQLEFFNEVMYPRRFYLFPYHSQQDLEARFATEDEMKAALDLRSVFMFPYSIVNAHFHTSKIRAPRKHDCFVQMPEKTARDIFGGDYRSWRKLGLDRERYKFSQPQDKVHIVTREGYLEQQILDSFHPKSVHL